MPCSGIHPLHRTGELCTQAELIMHLTHGRASVPGFPIRMYMYLYFSEFPTLTQVQGLDGQDRLCG